MEMRLPPEMEAFFRAGRRFDVDVTKLGFGAFTLKSHDELAVEDAYVSTYETPYPDEDPHYGESGRYVVPVVSLVKECQDYYDPFGQLLWVPGEGAFGTYDTEHDNLYLFSDTDWPKIEANPLPYLNVQWTADWESLFDLVEVKPWEKYRWFSKAENDAIRAHEDSHAP